MYFSLSMSQVPQLCEAVNMQFVQKNKSNHFSVQKTEILAILIIVPTFDTKVTDYLCSVWFFFLQTSFDFLTSHFDGIFKYHSKGIVVLFKFWKKKFHFFLFFFIFYFYYCFINLNRQSEHSGLRPDTSSLVYF